MKKKNKSLSILSILLKVFYILFTILFSIVFLSSLFRDGSVYYKLNHFVYLIIMIIIVILWFILYKFINSFFLKISKKKKKIIYISTFILIIGIFIFMYKNLDIPIGWDYGVIFEQAKNKVLIGNRGNIYPEYLQYFPNNISIYIVEVIIFKISLLVGYKDFLSSATIFNGTLIFFAILFTFLYCKKKYGDATGYFSLLTYTFYTIIFIYANFLF